MKQDEIIEMARQADFCVNEDGTSISTNNSYGIIQYELQAFAKLVAAKEREACAKVCEDLDAHRQVATWYSQAIRARGEQHE